MHQIPLIHPIYLDVPMLVSFAATVQGGLSLASEIKEQKRRSGSSTANLSTEFNLSTLFKPLFDLGAKENVQADINNEMQSVRKES
jgi:hypothetical protein